MKASEQLSTLLAKHRFKGILLDTNLLLLYSLGQLGVTAFSHSKRLQNFVPEDFVLLSAILLRVQRIVATPHVFTEASNLLGLEAPAFSNVARSELAKSLSIIEERSVLSRVSCQNPAFNRLGLTDVSIELIASNRLLVLTVDDPLTRHLESVGVDVLNFNHVRIGAW